MKDPILAGFHGKVCQKDKQDALIPFTSMKRPVEFNS